MRRWRIQFLMVALAGLGDSSLAVAQTPDPHAALPERPSIATHAYTVAPGWAEIEAGFARTNEDGRFGDSGVSLALKLGLNGRTQLTVATAMAHSLGTHTASVADVGLGVKVRLSDHVPLAGTFALLPSLTVPSGSDASSHETAAGVLAIASRTIGALSLDLNAGYTRRSGDGATAPRHEALWAAAAGGPLSHRFGWVGELSGSPRTTGPAGRDAAVNSLVGVTATLTPSVVIDVAAVLPVSGDGSFIALSGVVWNVGRLWTR